eukprot:TRINITY_DN97580_c0_g1_i1.p1 TRINITY_DN97580_c0_g1~~TRINITY_DN97580_c0_g1_i1.p1  ORF type:complete len:308 (+),score=61.30 TRINITY_DN97580_c0_g1_i1:80-1003(+)
MAPPRRGLAVGSRSGSKKEPEKPVKAKSPSRSPTPEKKEKEFAWMESDDEAEEEKKKVAKDSKDSKDKKKKKRSRSRSSSSSRGSRRKRGKRSRSRSRSRSQDKIKIDKVESFGQMAKLAPSIEKRLKRGEVRSKELCEIVAALARTKFFDGDLFEKLASELKRAFQRRSLGPTSVVETVIMLADLNAYNSDVFEAACKSLDRNFSDVPQALRAKFEGVLKKFNHEPGDCFLNVMKNASRDRRAACPLFWKGQCKWGPKCKLSHDQDNFEETMDKGRWKAPGALGNKSVGFQQSADLFKADRCGALW